MRLFVNIGFYILLLAFLNACGISKSINHQAVVEGYNDHQPVVKQYSDSLYISGTNSLFKNDLGLWELYISGDPLQLGLSNGALTEPLLHYQEAAFFSKVEDFVPSKFKQKLLRSFLKLYNRELYLHVPEEYKTEIYGLSRYASDHFNYIAPPYLRLLYLHAAHDIGHALQDLALVGCTSVAVWGEKSEDGKLLIGRNFDFYAGDDFAKNKIISFVNPDDGHPFMSVTWAGMIGVLSGMNKEGLTVTMNAGKSEIPLIAKTPVSILAREILQYAKTIDEAIAIAKKREVFVSESIMVGSAIDKRVVLIEVAPENFGIYEVQNSSNLICSNHFQSDAYKEDQRNIKHIEESHSQYRYDRMEELLDVHDKLNPEKMANILRNKKGHNDKEIGYGNEKALNQLMAHHAIIFKPEEGLVWVSSSPYQLGEFAAYDLNKIFDDKNHPKGTSFAIAEHNIPRDEFADSPAFHKYEKFRVYSRKIENAIEKNERVDPAFIDEYVYLNPDYWVAYHNVATYYYRQKWYQAAKVYYEKALTKEVTTIVDLKAIEKQLKKINRKLR